MDLLGLAGETQKLERGKNHFPSGGGGESVNIVTLLQPPRIVFGNGCAPQCAEFVAQRGVKRALMVTSTPVLPLLGGVTAALKKSGVAILVAPPVDCEPTQELFENILQVARAEQIDGVLGIGGGSAIDVAKLVAALARGKQNTPEVFGINLLHGRELPLVCLPTTAGTGAEVSPNAILLDETDELKKGVVSPHLVPDAAFVDPLLTLSVPPAVTAATGLDALTHCIEVYALAYPLGGRFHIAHGVSNALLLPHVLRFNFSAAPERYAEIAAALGVSRNGSVLVTAEHGVEFLSQLARDCGVPQKLSDLNIPREAIPWLAGSAIKVTRLLKNNLRPLTEADAAQIYAAAY